MECGEGNMVVTEFQIRAWQMDETHAQVLVHSSPAGDIRKPLIVPYNGRRLDDARSLFQSSWFVEPNAEGRLAKMGRQLADVLLPRPVYALLTSSLQTLEPDLILRIRLCLDSALVDLPWEYLYRPDVEDAASLTGFLLFDHRISLVREAPVTVGTPSALSERQRMLFAGALWSAGQDRWDPWGVQAEYQKLAESLASVGEFLSLEFLPAAGDIEGALSQPAAILHYSGHTDADRSSGYLVREMKTDRPGSSRIVSLDKMYSFELANLLQRARTRLAVFSACNSGRWAFVEPLLRAGLPALIGAQGVVSVRGAQVFCETLYAKLAVGLSLDEALTGARFQLLKEGGFNGRESLEWGTFMAYMPATEAVLLPRAAEQAGVASFQETARQRSQQAFAEVSGRIGPAPETASAIDQTSLRKAILKHFTIEEEAVLCADVKQALANDGVELDLDLDAVGGPAQGEEAMVLNLIEYLDRRGYLSYLIHAVRQARSGVI
jgi:hypothetical protein